MVSRGQGKEGSGALGDLKTQRCSVPTPQAAWQPGQITYFTLVKVL